MADATSPPVPFAEALRVWARIGLQSFGGPAAQIAVMHRVVVEEKRWVDEGRFLHALNYCILLPGPEAQQLCTYLGWLMHGWRGGLAAGLLFILPGAVVMAALSALYAAGRGLMWVEGLLFGLKAAVLAVVLEAVLRLGRRVLKNRAMLAVAVAGFLAIFLLHVPFPAIVAGAALLGWAGGRLRPDLFVVLGDKTSAATTAGQPWSRAIRVLLTGLALWFGPIAALYLAFGPEHVLVQIAGFFSRAAVVTFGGAYAVLAYVAQHAVQDLGWLAPGEMLDGLGLAETTPGPLILVLEFVGYQAGYRHMSELPPGWAGLAGAAVTLWVTFVPSFLWIFLGAPTVEALRGRRALNAALSAVTAAVVGVVLNLAVWFTLHVVFREVGEGAWGPLRWPVPAYDTIDPAAAILGFGSAVALLRLHLPLGWTLLGASALGLAWRLLG